MLFGTAINKMVTDEGVNGILFLEIAPHPVLILHRTVQW